MAQAILQVRIVTLTGMTLDVGITHSHSDVNEAFVSFCKVVRADGAFQNAVGCIPWHAIAQIIRPDQMNQQIALVQAPVPDGTKAN